ncbi:MAG: site-specific DNA-methyltransferase [Thaumarchaeota archaeon]|nr:site-specific DNA-methyltransferase [Nitrososphaerota archaeon]
MTSDIPIENAGGGQVALVLPKGKFHLVIRGHVLNALARIPDGSVDVIATSPPYYAKRDYRIEPSIWGGSPACAHEWSDIAVKSSPGGPVDPETTTSGTRGTQSGEQRFLMKSSACPRCGAWRGQLGHEPDFRLYIDHVLMVCAELKRVLKPTGVLFLNLGDTYNGGGSHRNTLKDIGKRYTPKVGELEAGDLGPASPLRRVTLGRHPPAWTIRVSQGKR